MVPAGPPSQEVDVPAGQNVSRSVTEVRVDLADQLLPGIRAVEKSILSTLTPAERTQLLDMLTKILARTAAVAPAQPEPRGGRRNRPARLGGLPRRT